MCSFIAFSSRNPTWPTIFRRRQYFVERDVVEACDVAEVDLFQHRRVAGDQRRDAVVEVQADHRDRSEGEREN
jgi:hypothetical protein